MQYTYLAFTEGSIRINGRSPSTGRVEIYYHGMWGTVCDDDWDIYDAHVVCRQLGFPQASRAFRGATHGQGFGPIWMDDVKCLGFESHLYECRHNGWRKHNCGHREDASVQCSNGPSTSVIRLVGGGFNYGRVEIYDNGQWGTVCNHDWDMNDAQVTCRQLGFTGATFAPKTTAYGVGTGPILRDHIHCTGTETSLLSCPHQQNSRTHCNHSEDAGVVCY